MNFLRRAGIIILFTIIGASIMSAPAIASFKGLFVKWEPIEAPPERPAAILEIDYFKSNTGNIYHHYYDAECKTGCWEEVETLPAESDYHVLPTETCDTLPFLPLTNNFVEYKKACIAWGAGTNMTAQAIDNDGYLYSWNHRLTELTFLTPLRSVIVGAVLGFIFGLSHTLPQEKKNEKESPKMI